MGFDLKQMIEALEEILNSDKKPAKAMKELAKELAWWKQYAKDCGQL